MFTNFLNSCLDAWDNISGSDLQRVVGFMLHLVYVAAFFFIILTAAYIFS